MTEQEKSSFVAELFYTAIKDSLSQGFLSLDGLNDLIDLLTELHARKLEESQS